MLEESLFTTEKYVKTELSALAANWAAQKRLAKARGGE